MFTKRLAAPVVCVALPASGLVGCNGDDTGGLSVPFLGKAEFVKNKRASGRPKDLLDIALLKEVEG